jgi:CDGSH-type Zn-finger protein
LIEDKGKKVSGPIWLWGRHSGYFSTDGETYEIRNQMTLCRCDRSANKPFCNGAHAA